MDRNFIAGELLQAAKEMTAAKASERDIDAIAKMTDVNDHTGALVYLYEKVLMDRRGASALKAMMVLHEYFGSMPRELSQLRYNEFYKPAMKAVESKFSEEDAAKIIRAF